MLPIVYRAQYECAAQCAVQLPYSMTAPLFFKGFCRNDQIVPPGSIAVSRKGDIMCDGPI